MASRAGQKKSPGVPKLPIADARLPELNASSSEPYLDSVQIVDTQILLDKDLRPFAVRICPNIAMELDFAVVGLKSPCVASLALSDPHNYILSY